MGQLRASAVKSSQALLNVLLLSHRAVSVEPQKAQHPGSAKADPDQKAAVGVVAESAVAAQAACGPGDLKEGVAPNEGAAEALEPPGLTAKAKKEVVSDYQFKPILD